MTASERRGLYCMRWGRDRKEVVDVKVPRLRWGGRWRQGLLALSARDGDGSWQVIGEYGRTAGYQVARALNLGATLPPAGDGLRWEFGTVEDNDGSRVVARRVEE